jgi:hypothetical protein
MSVLGKAVYNLYHRPIAFTSSLYKAGLLRSLRMRKAQNEMKKEALKLKEVSFPGNKKFTVYFLTGKKYWYQTAFCFYTFQKLSGLNIHAFFIDDGSFDQQLSEQVKKQFPSSTIVLKEEILDCLNKELPLDKFPAIRKRRLEYPHLRKLTDIHIFHSDGPKLVLDSDMLFFKKPDELINWMENPDSFVFMKDIEQSYGYNEDLMASMSKAPIPEKLNVGIAGIHSERISWKKVNEWISQLQQEAGTSYLQEQAITAMVASSEKYRFLNDREYKVLPQIKGKEIPEILHHYVADSKYDYYVKGWKLALDITADI